MKIFSDDMKAILDRAEEIKEKLKGFGFAEIDIDFRIEVLKRGFAGVAYTGESGYMYVDERRPRLGTAYRERPVVKISPDYLKEYREEILHRTVPHEICHCYVHHYYPRAKQAHGPEFRRMMRLLGLDGSTYHSMKLENGPKKRVYTKKRYGYKNPVSGEMYWITKAKHEKVMKGLATLYAKGGVAVVFTGEVKEVK